jgi:hypothetical protein
MKSEGMHLIPLISHLDRVLESLTSMKNAFEQANKPNILEDYYNLMVALERTKEAKERLLTIHQKQEQNPGEKNPLMGTLRSTKP